MSRIFLLTNKAQQFMKRGAIQGGQGAYHGIAAENFFAGEEVEMEENGSKVEYKILYVGKEKDDSDILAIIE